MPPQPSERLQVIRALIAQEQQEPAARSGKWEDRLVTDERVADILVVSDSPMMDRDVNRRIEAALRALDATFAVSGPMAIDDEPADQGVIVPIGE